VSVFFIFIPFFANLERKDLMQQSDLSVWILKTDKKRLGGECRCSAKKATALTM